MNKELIKSGAVKAITVKRPKDMGYVQVWLMTYLLRGGKVKDGLEIPNLGKIHLKGNTIYPDAATFTDVTAENIDQFNFYESDPVHALWLRAQPEFVDGGDRRMPENDYLVEIGEFLRPIPASRRSRMSISASNVVKFIALSERMEAGNPH